MDTPGITLKTEREHQGKTLKEISVNLKLSTEYLTALEEDNYSQLPAEVFTKAYLRLYADELGINGDYVLELFHEFGHDDVEEKTKLPEKKFERSSLKAITPVFNAFFALVIKILSFLKIILVTLKDIISSFSFNHGSIKKLKPSFNLDFTFVKRAVQLMANRKFLLTALAVAAAILIAIMINNSDKQLTDSYPVPVKETIAADKVSSDIKKTKSVDKNKVQEKPIQKKTEDASGKLVLRIIAEELTWASVSIDGGEYRESLLRAGEELTVRADGKFNLKIGNAGGTKLVLNGRELGKLGPDGKVVNIKLP